jgi:hypothetical protein
VTRFAAGVRQRAACSVCGVRRSAQCQTQCSSCTCVG